MKNLEKTNRIFIQHSSAKNMMFDDSDKARMMFKMAFLTTMGKIYLYGFNNRSRSLSQIQTMCIAEKYNRDIVCGDVAKYWIDYPSLQISAGTLSKPEFATCSVKNEKEILVEWDCISGKFSPSGYSVYIMQYDHNNKTSHIWEATAKKLTDSAVLAVVPGMEGHKIHHWMFFSTEDGKNTSDSVYMGMCKL